MKLFILAITVLGCSAMQPLTSDISRAAAASDYIAWKEHYGINDADERRFTTFSDNRALVISHNAQYTRGEVSFSLELNEFAAMTNAEPVMILQSTFLGCMGRSAFHSHGLDFHSRAYCFAIP